MRRVDSKEPTRPLGSMNTLEHASNSRVPASVYKAVVVFYVFLFLALMWPIYPRFASIEPRVIGLPFSLIYVIGGLVLSFLALWGLYLWEEASDDDIKATEPEPLYQSNQGQE